MKKWGRRNPAFCRTVRGGMSSSGNSPKTVVNWLGHLWREWTVKSWRPVAPAAARPEPALWSPDRVTASWLGHSTVLLNLSGFWILTDPVLFPRIGIRLPFLTLGPKRLTAPALRVDELPPIDLVLLSHAHFDHLDRPTLRRLRGAAVIVPSRVRDLVDDLSFRSVHEVHWGDEATLAAPSGPVRVRAFPVAHWGARLRRDTWRGYNGYVVQHRDTRIIFGGDSALTESFAALRDDRPYDLAIMSIGAYQPWIRAHCTPEQAIAMAGAAGARFIMPVHHQTFRLSFEPFREPIERFTAALAQTPERIALRDIGETFVLPAREAGPP